MTQELRILTPQGMLGYGVPAEHFWRARSDLYMQQRRTGTVPHILKRLSYIFESIDCKRVSVICRRGDFGKSHG